MASLFDKVKKAGETVVQAAKDLGDTAELKIEKAQLNSDIEHLYIEIGKAIVERNEPEFAEQIAQIKEKKARICAIEEEVGDIQGKVKCPKCGKMVDEDSRFCPVCGESLKG